MAPSEETLKGIAEAIIAKLQSASTDEAGKLMQMNDYHGFLKAKMPEDFLSEILSPYYLTPQQVQIEIVKVDRDLSSEIHYHEGTHAYCVIIGDAEKAENPRNAKAFLKDTWSPIVAGDIVSIPPGTPHGFTVEDGGILVFLSVQSPPIEREGNDDYHKVAI